MSTMTGAGTNWSRTLAYRAEAVVEARTIDEVSEVVAASSRVRALGTRHSFSDIADTEHRLVTVTGIEPDPVLDEAAGTVTVGAGIRYGVLAGYLQEHGWALPNMGSLPHISVAGAVATGTHGSGTGSLSSAVDAVELVVADGTRRVIRRGDPGFDGVVVALGALGVVVRIGLDVEPTYQVRQDVYAGLSWDDLFAAPQTVMAAGYSVSIFTNWREPAVPEIIVKMCGDGAGSTAPADPPAPAVPFEAELLDELGRQRFAGPNQTPRGIAGPWCERLPHFRLDSTPSHGEELQTEYLVPLEQAGPALRAVHALGPALADSLIVTELRTTMADPLWLSPAHEQDSLCVHFTWRDDPDGVRALIPQIEAALRPFNPRPHWGKLFQLDALDVDARYPRAGDFRELAADLDPAGKFRNDFLQATVWA